MLLTGDTQRVAAALAAEVGIEDVRADLLPQDKVDAVRALQREGQWVLLVGDGVNDAPRWPPPTPASQMGKAGSDLTLDAADAIIVGDAYRRLAPRQYQAMSDLWDCRELDAIGVSIARVHDTTLLSVRVFVNVLKVLLVGVRVRV
ncbi:MAG: HAD family hydrolase [Pseudonocardiaceae bacterium]